MLDLLFLISTVVALVCLFYLYLKAKKQLKFTQDDLATTASRLQLSSEVEQHLRDELNAVQGKFQASLEDPVTNLLGWPLFEDRINHAIKECERYQLTMGILFVDIDDFKMINDALSYEIGDSLLREVARRLESSIRQVDTLTRFAKDTFAILLSQLAKPETAAIVAQRILQNFHEPFVIQDNELVITVSIGISIFPTDGEHALDLLRSADHALHLAKESGQHTYKFYQERLHTKSVRELAIYSHLSRENLFQEFAIYYQPIIDVSHETIFAMDALLHWQHAQLGLVSPQELFAYAEKQRKLNAISEWLVETACKQFIRWRSLGFAAPCIGIPITIRQLENTQFIYRISHILQALSFHPDWLLLEVKETHLATSFEAMEKALNMLKYLGVKIAIDDFASPLSFSLLNLKHVKLEYLKLTPDLITNITTDEKTRGLVEAIIHLAHKISTEIIIQGIETSEQVELLKSLGCKLMQGRFLGVPLSENEVAQKMVSTD